MATPVFQVWLVNLVPLGTTVRDSTKAYYYTWNVDIFNTLISELQGLFQEVCAGGQSKFGDANVSVNVLPAKLGPSDVIIRCTTSNAGLAADKYRRTHNGARPTTSSGGPPSGLTLDMGPGVCSEIWLDIQAGNTDIGARLARIAFHEAMHNKLDVGPGHPISDIHRLDPVDGLSRGTPIDAFDHPTNKDIQELAPRLDLQVAQFLLTMLPP